MTFTFLMIAGNTAFWIACCFLPAYAVRKLPTAIYRLPLFMKSTAFEQRIWKVLRVPRWKDHLPEWGHVFHFQKRSLQTISPAYIERFIQETKYAELGHVAMAILGFLCIPLNPPSQFTMALCCALVNMCIQLPFCIIQRYNRPRLLRIQQRLIQKAPNM